MKFKTALLSIGILTGFGSLCHASVTINVSAEVLNDAFGVGSPTDEDTLVALVADTNNNGVSVWEGALSVGGFLDNAPSVTPNTDLILGLKTLGFGSGMAGTFYDGFNGLDFTGAWGSGDNLYLVWFPTYTTSTISSVGGASYGSIFLGITPDDTNTANFEYLTAQSTNFAGSPGSMPDAIANLTVQPVPEPSSFFVLAGLGLMGLLRRRVRRPAN